MKVQHTLCWALPFFQFADAKVVGVSREEQALYNTNKAGQWACLSNPDILLTPSQINDGVCDCPDGSDEPGTSACVDTLESRLFYCENAGFKPRYIRGSLVNDGVCDCCDCSDEPGIEGMNVCKDLAKTFSAIAKVETQNYKSGQAKLKVHLEEFQIPLKLDEASTFNSTEQAILEEDIEALNDEMESLKNLLKKSKQNFYSKLEIENPSLLHFEKIDFNYLTTELKEVYGKIETTSRAYMTLMKILKELYMTYTEAQNDRVVNKNMDEFDVMMSRPEMKKVVVDPDTDVEQLSQLLDYFNDELPAIFWDMESEFPADYVIKKAKFVMAMVDGKVNYMETLRDYIKEFAPLMADIAENYNVNFQDASVLSAVEAFDKYISQYSDITEGEKYELPQKFITEFNNLVDVIVQDVPELLADMEEGADTLNTGKGHKIGNLQARDADSPYGTLSTDLESLKEQIDKYENDIHSLAKDLKEKNTERDILLKLEEQETLLSQKSGLTPEERATLKQATELVERMDDSSSTIIDTLDNYVYEISLNPLTPGAIFQREDKEHGSVVRIGTLSQLHLDKKANIAKFADHIKLEYSDDDIITHLFNESVTVGERSYLFDHLEEINSGLVFEYTNGEKCWNGPQRSAKVFMKCSDKFGIQNVYEKTKCSYIIEASGPLGCNLEYSNAAN